jgi:UDP-N-acetylmuramoyl-L-alanyl-D-glutamate--2,6-diaminopimelate ligase
VKKLSEILQNIPVENIKGNPDVFVNKIFIDSRYVTTNSLFIAQPGVHVDGHKFINDVIKAGAKSIVCEKLPAEIKKNITYVQVKDTILLSGLIADSYFDNPSSKMKVIGVTGTNGKTTIATLLYRLYRRMGQKVGLLSTVVNYIDSKMVESTHTTPDAVTVHKLMGKMVEAGCKYCFMEVSSHAIVQHRINGVRFVGGIFTNLTHDHLDYHKTFDEYLAAKKKYFDELPGNAFALTNIDDKNGKVMVQNTKAKVSTYALHSMADFNATIRESHFDGMLLNINNVEMWTRLIGQFNASNILAIYATAVLLGSDKEKIMMELSDLYAVDGRFEYFSSPKGYIAVVDYAHTPDALLNVLRTIRQLIKADGKIISVVGAGGNRDKTKRPVMAKVSAELSDKVILTSDNPRNEKPEDIIADMKAGLDTQISNKVLTITNRREAIRAACQFAVKGDVVLIAGKGHETYQEINGVKHYFDDRVVVKEIFNEKE